MKKNGLTFLMVILLCGTVMFSSCIGSFKLTNKLHSWNQGVGSKFANELVFFCFWVLPVYEISILADVLVLNSVEFWSGSNPVADNGKTKQVKGAHGDYLVQRKKDGYKISDRRGKTNVDLRFDEETQTWMACSKGKSVRFMTFIGNNKVRMYLPEGKTMDVELSEEGVMAYRDAIGYDFSMFAAR